MTGLTEGEYEVVHEYVNVRSSPSTKGRVLATLRRGVRLRATPFRVGGEPWLRLVVASLPESAAKSLEDEDAAWALADASGTPLCVGELLRRLEGPSVAGLELGPDGGRLLRLRCLSGAVHEVLVDCLWDERDLKAAAGRAASMPSEEVRLLRGTEELSCEALRELLWGGEELEELTLVRDVTHARSPMRLSDWLPKIIKDWRCLKEAPEEVRADAEAVFLAVKQDWTALLHAAPQLRGHRDVAFAAVGTDWRAFEHVDAALRGDPQLALAAARQSVAALRFADDRVFKDRKVMVAAIGQQPELLERASDELRRDRSLALAAVKLKGTVLRFTAPQLQADWQVVRTAVESDGLALQYACDVLRGDRHVVLTAARQNPKALAYASPEIFEHPDVAIAAAAVRQWPDVLRDTGERLYTLPKVRNAVLAAVSADGSLLRHAHDSLRYEKEVVLAAVSQSGLALEFAPSCFQEDDEVVLTAVQEDWHALHFASEDVVSQRGIVVAAVGQSLDALELLPAATVRNFWVDPYIWGDPEVVLDLVAQDGRLLRYATPEVAKDREVVLKAVGQNWEAYRTATLDIREDRDVVMAIVAQDPAALGDVPEKFRADRRVVLAAVQAHGTALQHATPWLHRNRELVLQAVRQDPEALAFASEELRADAEVLAAAREGAVRSLEAAGAQQGARQEEPAEPQGGGAEPPGAAGGGRGCTVGSVEMCDPEGELGLYTGPLDEQGRAEGEGEFVYEDGERFVGCFSAGAMRTGVLYSQRTKRPRDTMRDGEWTEGLDDRIVRAFPVHKASCQAKLRATEEVARKAVQDKLDAKREADMKRVAARTALVRKARPLHAALRAWRRAVTDKALIDAFAEWKAQGQWRTRRRLDARWKEEFFPVATTLLPAPTVQPLPVAAPHPRRLWTVVGGEGKGGIIARELESTSSTPLHERLATGATVEELQLKGNRLHFKRINGAGPEAGWVSIAFEGRPLVKRLA